MIRKSFWNYLAPFILATIIFVSFQLQGFSLGLGFRDEGFLNLASTRIIQGEIPYRDFFLTTTPGSFYLQSLAMSYFGDYLIISRIIYIFSIIGILFLVSIIYKPKLFYRFVTLVALAVLFVSPAALGFYNIEGLLLCLIAFYFLRKRFLFLSGLFIGIVFLFKQSYGIWVGLGFLLVLITDQVTNEQKKEDVFKFILGCITSVISYLLYLSFHNALGHFIYNSFVFAGIVKAHRNAFVIKAILGLPMLFLIFMLIPFRSIKRYSRIIVVLFFVPLFYLFTIEYFEPSRVYYLFFLTLPIWALAKIPPTSKENIFTRNIAIFSLFFFLANASSGRSIGIANVVSPLYIPLFINMVEYVNKHLKIIPGKIVPLVLAVIIFVNVVYLSWGYINPNGAVFGIYKKSELTYELEIKKARFIKVSNENKKEIDGIVKFIDKNYPDKMLICFPYCPLMNVLTGKLSPTYFNFFYPETFLPENQNRVIADLKKSDTVILVQKKGTIEREAEYEDGRLSVLKKYLVKNYNKDLETENFIIYSNTK